MQNHNIPEMISTEQFTEITDICGEEELWGIINYARQGANHHVWHACPSIRAELLIGAAFKRWEAFYSNTNACAWLSFARYLGQQRILEDILSNEHS